jgi:sec-independent protein translocase protein TatC|tara:strand:- start:8717 stop:9478 length:762 start_codon:yes stop_codon:yes gene_type:complete
MQPRLVNAQPFCFKPLEVKEELTLVVAFSDHIEELRQRIFQSLIVATFLILLFFLNSQYWVHLLADPVNTIKFIQLAPGEYFISTVKIAIYAGLLFSVPMIGSQLILFILPGLNKNETEILLPLIFLSTALFILGLFFSYKILIPAALNFFISYSAEFVEPLWSFDEYLNFITLLFFTTGITFQIPLVQVLLGLIEIVTSDQMIKGWKYVLVGSTVIGAVLTPSTDPITQICLSLAVIFLYVIGVGILKVYGK